MLGRTVGYSARTALWVVAAAWGVAGCALTEARHAYAVPAASHETGVYRAIVVHFQQAAKTPLRINPRPVRYDANLTGIEADDFAAARVERTSPLNAVLLERGVEASDATRDWRCVFTIGPPAFSGDSLVDAYRPECGRLAYTSAVLSVPESLPDSLERSGVVRVRAMTMTLSSYAIWNFELSSDGSGVWKILRFRRESGMSS